MLRHRRRGSGGALAPPLEINSGKFEIIRVMNVGGDLFLKTTLILREKGKNYYIWKYFGLNIPADSV